MHRSRGVRVRARAEREGRRDASTVDNSGSKLKIWHTGPLGNLLLFPSMGRGTSESKYRWRKVVYNNCTKSPTLVAYPPVFGSDEVLDEVCTLDPRGYIHEGYH
jgi:hypothetical protein